MGLQNLLDRLRNKSIDNETMKLRNDPPEAKLANILNTAYDLLWEIKANKYHLDNPSNIPFFYLIRILTDYIMMENTVYCLENDNNKQGQFLPDEKPVHDVGLDLFFRARNEVYRQEIYDDLHSSKLTGAVTINLAHDPVLAFPWVSNRLIGTLQYLGKESDNPWKENNHHLCTLHLPMGITEVYNGRHSSFCGMLKREGEITITSKCRHQVVDYSKLYSYIHFDGEYYNSIPRGERLGKAKNFEFGCLYEIGRLMYDNNIVFKDIECTDIQ